MNIRLFEKTDAIAVSEMIRKTIRISNTKDYPLELMEALIESETPLFGTLPTIFHFAPRTNDISLTLRTNFSHHTLQKFFHHRKNDYTLNT